MADSAYSPTNAHDDTKINASEISDAVPMLDDPNKVVTSHAALTADLAVLAQQNKVQVGAGVATGAWAYLAKANTNGSGVATIYITSDGTSGGTAVFSTVYEDGIVAMPVGSDNYQVTSVVLAGNKKSIAVTINKITTVLGLLTSNSNGGSGIEVRATVWGK